MTEPALALDGVSVDLGRFALRRLDLKVAPGETLILLGPNGAGKSVCLETVAGFHRPDRGRILIAGRDVTSLPPERRRVGFLFQNFGLFPHLTVAENVAIGARGADDPQATAALLDRFGIGALADRRPALLSPGERQRAALARALASRPDLFLFDEPFSALDAGTRESLRDELAAFFRETGVAAIFVTHDHTDALALGTRLAILAEGAILQEGFVEEIFARPASRAIAGFLGVENVLEGCVVGAADGLLRVAVGTAVVLCHSAVAPAGARVALCLRAGDIRIGATASDGTPINRLIGRIVALQPRAPLCRLMLDCGFPLVAYLMLREARERGLTPGMPVTAEFGLDSVHLLAETEAPFPRSAEA